MANEDKKDFNAMLHDNKDMPKFQIITDEKSIEKYGGNRMYFAPPIAYDEVMKKIPYGKVITVGKIREFFAKENGADFTEPITAGIFVSIAAWASHQRLEDKTPYWRTLLYGICLGRMGATEKQTIYLSLLFLGGITIVAFIVLRVLSYFNRKRRRISVNGEQRDIPTSKLGCTKIYNAKDIVEAGRIVELLKEHGIAAFSQEAGASVSMHGASGFGMYGMDVLVETDEVKRALQIIEAADDSQGSEKF